MAYYLVTAKPRTNKLNELESKLNNKELVDKKPFGKALTYSLENARKIDEETAIWVEEDYCNPPLAQERLEVLDEYFEITKIEPTDKDKGWKGIYSLPRLFQGL